MSPLICPDCGEKYIRRVRHAHAGELLLGLIYCYPFCCQVCGARFRIFQWGVRYRRRAVDRRRYTRTEVDLPVRLSTRGGEHMETRVVDLSIGGCRIQDHEGLVPGNILAAEIELLEGETPLKIRAAIVRSSQEGSSSLEFLEIGIMEKLLIGRYVAKLKGE